MRNLELLSSILCDSNPEGINQYTGGGSTLERTAAAHAATVKEGLAAKAPSSQRGKELLAKGRTKMAESASKNAKTIGNRLSHVAAENYHRLAEKANREAGNKEQAEHHAKLADFHVGAAERAER